MNEKILGSFFKKLTEWVLEKSDITMNDEGIKAFEKEQVNNLSLSKIEKGQTVTGNADYFGVEMIYNIGKVIGENWKLDTGTPEKLFMMLQMKYKKIEQELERIETYYKNNELSVELKEKFENSLQVKLILHPDQILKKENLKNSFIEIMAKILSEHTKSITDPER